VCVLGGMEARLERSMDEKSGHWKARLCAKCVAVEPCAVPIICQLCSLGKLEEHM